VSDVATKSKEANRVAIKDRNLDTGSVLAGTYKKELYECRVEEEGGKQAFVLDDGRRFKSASAAASAVMNGKAVNGWLFWSLVETDQVEISPTKPPEKQWKMIKRLPNQQGIENGKARYWCNACMKSFVGETDPSPQKCPAGHGDQERE
jgi:hypothetical protein